MAQRAWLLVAVSVVVSLAVVSGLWLGFGSGGGTADGYGLSSWGDDCAGTPATSATCSLTMEADKTVSATFAVAESEPLSLIVVSDGSHDSLLLEWTGGPANATKWQYRQRRWENVQPLAWEAWTDVPGSGAGVRTTTGSQDCTTTPPMTSRYAPLLARSPGGRPSTASRLRWETTRQAARLTRRVRCRACIPYRSSRATGARGGASTT